mmetsp:Transcript_28171/g.81445  ORF Transcript_28171/g.81445 Transcript_28171/m.81445 type:complete len:303 (+) Transcript_28171:1216-2124(+)
MPWSAQLGHLQESQIDWSHMPSEQSPKPPRRPTWLLRPFDMLVLPTVHPQLRILRKMPVLTARRGHLSTKHSCSQKHHYQSLELTHRPEGLSAKPILPELLPTSPFHEECSYGGRFPSALLYRYELRQRGIGSVDCPLILSPPEACQYLGRQINLQVPQCCHLGTLLHRCANHSHIEPLIHLSTYLHFQCQLKCRRSVPRLLEQLARVVASGMGAYHSHHHLRHHRRHCQAHSQQPRRHSQSNRWNLYRWMPPALARCYLTTLVIHLLRCIAVFHYQNWEGKRAGALHSRTACPSFLKLRAT